MNRNWRRDPLIFEGRFCACTASLLVIKRLCFRGISVLHGFLRLTNESINRRRSLSVIGQKIVYAVLSG